MWKRNLATQLTTLSQEFPAVLLLGPRQVGKTTLAKITFPNAHYCDLEDPKTSELFKTDIIYQLTRHSNKTLILDEAQSLPQIFNALRSLIDNDRKTKGKFIILGSAQPSLIRQVSESLAGRIGTLELPPLMLSEVTLDYQTLWLKGGFPDPLQNNFRLWWHSYLKTFIERDLAIWGIQTDPSLMYKLLTMLAHQQGSLFNSSEIARALGISYHTVNRYISILEGAFLIRQLQPFFVNIKKRLVKSPKIYIRDTGLLHHLLNINSIEELESHPIRGQSWETFVLEDLIKRENLSNPFTRYYFFRTQAGLELDLLFERGSSLLAFEIKSGSIIKSDHIKKLTEAIQSINAQKGFIINQSSQNTPLKDNITNISFPSNPSWLP